MLITQWETTQIAAGLNLMFLQHGDTWGPKQNAKVAFNCYFGES